MAHYPLSDYYQTALEKLGPQHWWPGETPFEVCVGAILTQNTNWKNVEKAITNLKKKNLLEAHKLHALPINELAELIRPAGYFNIKAKRLKNFLTFLINDYQGDLANMSHESIETLREKLLSVRGIGPETADSMILYALNKPSFVVDAYTRRIFVRHQVVSEEADYYEIKGHFECHVSNDVQNYNEFHALIVNIGKNWCRPKNPDCEHCPWRCYLPEN